jgi:hypothetical protein
MIETLFVRLFSPATILTADTGTFKRSASSRRSASFARSSTGGAVSCIFCRALILACDRIVARSGRNPHGEYHLAFVFLNVNQALSLRCRTLPPPCSMRVFSLDPLRLCPESL